MERFDQSEVILIVTSLVTGVLFALLAVILSTTHGNRMADIEGRGSDQHPLDIELLNKLKIATGVPVVGLWVLSVICAIAFPSTLAYTHYKRDEFMAQTNAAVIESLAKEDALFTFNDQFDRAPKTLCIQPLNVSASDTQFSIPLRYTAQTQSYIVKADGEPIDLNVTLAADSKTLHYDINGIQRGSVPLEGTIVRGSIITLSRPGSVSALPVVDARRQPKAQSSQGKQ